MKKLSRTRFSLSLLLLITLLLPASSFALGDGKKYFKAGVKYESTEEWDKAAEFFALAVTENPKNPEYRLHLQRSLFNASQMYMKKGRTAAEEGDYEGAYVAFRKAYAYDPVNELAKSEMARMMRLQEAYLKSTGKSPSSDANGVVRVIPTAYNDQKEPDDFPMPQRLEKLRDVPFPSGVNLQFLVKELAKDLDLNVLFDVESRLEGRTVRIELRNVTAAKALDYIFLQENLFFQRVGPRTILVATGLRRQNFQQLVLRTFYLANANPKDVKTIVQTAIPAQQGRSQTIVLEDAATNSITIRDTQENIRLIGKLISSLDKDRAEVVMDVAIYEVNKNDLLQLGNQIGNSTDGTLTNLGGVGFPFARSGTTGPITSNIPFPGLGNSSIAVGLPISTIAALQSKNNTKLIASTQIHAFNNEDSSARIGQRVPVRTASFVTAANTSNNGVVSDVINYEQVGLTLKFKPIVFPNQDVQVAMEIESKDVAGALTQTPVFTERTIKGTARVQNNKTLLLASVAQGVETTGRTGLPLLGLIPILGRLFTAPTRDNRQIDIVIAVTPRVIRAPAILPDDEVERPTGSIATPTSGSLEAMIIQEEREEYLASVRRLPNTAQVQLPDRANEGPEYVRTGTAAANAEPAKPVETESTNAAADRPTQNPVFDALKLKPIDSSVKSLDFGRTSLASRPETVQIPVESAGNAGPVRNLSVEAPVANLRFPVDLPQLKTGETARIPVLIECGTLFRSAVLGLSFDDKKLAVRSVLFGDVFGSGISETAGNPFLNQNGKMFISLKMPDGNVSSSTGILAFIDVQALQDGSPEITFEKDVLNISSADGKNILVRF